MGIQEIIAALPPVVHDLLLLGATALAGIALGRIRIGGVRLGLAGVLFAGLGLAHLGVTPDPEVGHFLKEFGLVLFVFALGLQMGPGFFASLRRYGLRLNGYAALLVALGGGLSLLWGALLGWETPVVVGVFCGATTNTPALGAAQEALRSGGPGVGEANLAALSYAATYPLAVVGIILGLVCLRWWFGVAVPAEAEAFRRQQGEGVEPLERLNLRVENPNLAGLAFSEVPGVRETGVVVSRIRRAGAEQVEVAGPGTVLGPGDTILAVGRRAPLEQFRRVVGSVAAEDLMLAPGPVGFRRVVVTNRAILGKSVRELGLDHLHGVTVTRVTRGDLNFTALPDLRLQFGDRLQLVGSDEGLEAATGAVGNAVKQLEETNFAGIFAGLLLGVVAGLVPISLPGLASPVKLGLAGGPLVVAIVLGKIGRLGPLLMHLPANANRALRELGMILFLSQVGLLSGAGLADTVFTAQGIVWVLAGFSVTVLPLLLVGTIARRLDGMNYMNLSGLLSGGMTDPPALAFASGLARCDSPAVAYAAVYPLTMVLRIVTAQLLAMT